MNGPIFERDRAITRNTTAEGFPNKGLADYDFNQDEDEDTKLEDVQDIGSSNFDTIHDSSSNADDDSLLPKFLPGVLVNLKSSSLLEVLSDDPIEGIAAVTTAPARKKAAEVEKPENWGW